MKKIGNLLKQLECEIELLSKEESKNYVGGTDIPKSGNMYAVFDRSSKLITMYWDGGTPNDRSDDVAIFSGMAHNNVIKNCNGIWPNGEYTMLDQSSGLHHPDHPEYDTPNGKYGPSGIYRAKNFTDSSSGDIRTGMGVHAGREHKDFDNRKTEGCIRVEQPTMTKIDSLTSSGWKWKKIIVQD